MTLKNKKIVLLGGSSGFGFATAIAAAKEGAGIVVVSGKQEKVNKALAALPAGTEGYAVNVTSERELSKLFNDLGAFDHLVFTAGEALHLSELNTLNMDAARHFFETRFWGGFMAAKYAAQNINAGGSITLTNGIVGLRPLKGWTVAASICGAVESLTRALAVELAPIRVNTVCAGVVKTDLWNNIPEQERHAMYDNIGAAIPAGRAGEANDLAKAYMYLMQQEFCTGQCLVVDGGAVLV
jgi:NAD(P)-dependent dehydrogenase (short-subunit alcohol dehydrogenase family)